jgi:hypothetical protein
LSSAKANLLESSLFDDKRKLTNTKKCFKLGWMVSLDQGKTNSEKNYSPFMSMMQVVGNPEGWGSLGLGLNAITDNFIIVFMPIWFGFYYHSASDDNGQFDSFLLDFCSPPFIT